MGNDALSLAQTPCPPEAVARYYTLQEAAAELNVCVAELEHAIQNHRLPFVHQFGRKLVAQADVDAYRVQHAGHQVPPRK